MKSIDQVTLSVPGTASAADGVGSLLPGSLLPLGGAPERG